MQTPAGGGRPALGWLRVPAGYGTFNLPSDPSYGRCSKMTRWTCRLYPNQRKIGRGVTPNLSGCRSKPRPPDIGGSPTAGSGKTGLKVVRSKERPRSGTGRLAWRPHGGLGDRPPTGPGWIHEIKHDGYRLIARRDGAGVRLLTRNGHDWSNRYPSVASALGVNRHAKFARLNTGTIQIAETSQPWTRSASAAARAIRCNRRYASSSFFCG